MATVKPPGHLFKLPDIASGPTPADKSHDITKDLNVSNSVQGTVAMETDVGKSYHGNNPKFPKIVLRDVIGRELDTDTSYQRAINEARWKLSKGECPSAPEEWRLPYGALPARPDYTRTAPPIALKRLFKKELKKMKKMYNSLADFPEALEANKDYEPLRWSLQQVETLPALIGADLLKEAGSLSARTYMPFVGTAPMINKPAAEIDKREAEYEFPGFCYGCSKGTGLCYGCERDTRPHFHHDKPYRTGGGFSYYKRDKAYGELSYKNPANWKVSLPAPRGLPPTSYVFYDDLKYPDLNKYGVKVRVAHLPDGLVYPREAFSDAKTGTVTESGGPARRDVTFATDTSQFDSGQGGTIPDSAIFEGPDGTLMVDLNRLPSDMTYDRYLHTLGEYTSDEEEEEEEEESDEDKRSKEKTDSTTTSSKKTGLYKAPKPFTLKSRERQVTIAVDPFSKDRQYDINLGKGLDIKKSDKALTQFDEFRFGEGTWEEPDPFKFKDRPETVHEERQRVKEPEPIRKSKTQIVVEEPKKKPVKVPPASSDKTPKPKKEEPVVTKPKKEKTPPPAKENPKPKSPQAPGSKSAKRKKSPQRPEPVIPEPEPEPMEEEPPAPGEVREKKHRAPVVKKERKQREPPVRKTRRESEKKDAIEEEPEEEDMEEKPQTPEPEDEEPEPESEPEPELVMEFKEHRLPTPPPMRRVAPPPLPRAIPPVPPLPREYTDIDKPKREVSQTMIEAPPPMYEPPKQRQPPPMKRPKMKTRERRFAQYRSSETPATKTDPREMVDPLDYLAKYCIIHKDRLPHYERIFTKVLREQMYRYVDVPHEQPKEVRDDNQEVEELDAAGPAVKTSLNAHEEKMINDLHVINRSTKEEFSNTGYNIGDQNVQRVHFTLDSLIDKFEDLQEKHDKLQGDRILLMAEIARQKFPEVTKPNYSPKKKKKKGKKKKKVEEAPPPMTLGGQDAAIQTDGEEVQGSPKAPKRVTEVDIVARLSNKMLEEINKDPDVCQVNMEITRFQEKLRDVDDRIEDLEDEKKLMQLYSRDVFHKDISKDSKPTHFIRQQSALYQKMHQQEDPEMNLAELEEALQQINGHLITEKELQFIFHILDLQGRRRINLQLFCVIAALSEKIKQVDPFIRKLINKLDYEALTTKMNRSKELFWLLDEQDEGVPSGTITSSSLAVELAAGGVTPEHAEYVVNKFSRENKGIVDFMDYLTYVPLFIEIHGRIVHDPLSNARVF